MARMSALQPLVTAARSAGLGWLLLARSSLVRMSHISAVPLTSLFSLMAVPSRSRITSVEWKPFSSATIPTSSLAAAHSSICMELSLSARASKFLMVFEHCSHSVFRARSKATAEALVRMAWSLSTR